MTNQNCLLKLLAALLIGSALASCGVLQPAALYDEKIEKTVTEFDEAILTHIAKMQGFAKLEKGTYGENVAFYTKWKVKLDGLRNHAISREVGTACGPEEITDDIITGGITSLNGALQAAQSVIDTVKVTALDPAKLWVQGKRDLVKAELTEAEKTLNAASLAKADFARLERRVDQLTNKFERWHAASNRVTGAISSLRKKQRSKSFEGGCTTRLVTNLAEQFAGLERFHMKQQDLGIPARSAPAILMSVPIQVILKVQQRKKVLAKKGFF